MAFFLTTSFSVISEMRRGSIAMLVAFILLMLMVSVEGRISGHSDTIPLGAIFDHTEQEVQAAFSYEIKDGNKHRNKQEPRKLALNPTSRSIMVDDSFSLTTTLCSLTANGIFALFGTHSIDTLRTLKTYINRLHMPYITTSQPMVTPDQMLGYELYMLPDYTKALLDLITHYGWKRVHYVYDSNEGLQRLQNLFDLMTERKVYLQVDMRRVNDVKHAHNILRSMAGGDDSKHILIDMRTKDVEELLHTQIKNKDPWRSQFHYMLTGLGVFEITKLEHTLEHGGINMTGLRLVDPKNESARVFLEEWEKQDPKTWPGAGRPQISYEAALAVDAVRLLVKTFKKIDEKYSHIIKNTLRGGKFINNNSEGIDCDGEPLVPWAHGHQIMKIMREMSFYGLTGHVAFHDNGTRKDYELDVLEVNVNRGLAKIGTWFSKKPFTIQKPSLVRNKGNNTIANRTRVVTSILTEPYLMLKANPDGTWEGNDRFEGYCADVAQKIADIVQFEYIIRPVVDGKYGSKENGTWNGMVGELVNNEADLAIAPLTITSARERVIDFSKPFMSLGISIMIRKPNKANPGVFSFMYPLSYEIWMCVIFAYIGVSVVLFLVSRFSPFEWHIEDNTEGPTVTNNFTIFNSLWFSLGAFMQQGCDIEPRSMSGRIVGSVWWFFTLIVISSYTANLAAFLTVERMHSPIESAEDLAKQTEIKYGTVDSGSTKEFFKGSTIPTYERMWAFMDSQDPSVFVNTNEAGVAKVRKNHGRYAFLTESTTNDYINQRKPCNTMKVGSNLDSKGYGIGTPLGSDLRDRITLAVLKLREEGELHKLKLKWWYEKSDCGKKQEDGKKTESTSALRLSNVAGIFYILVGGLCLALFVAVLEFMYKSKMEAKRRNTTFTNAIRSKARLSIKGKPEKQTTAVRSPDMAPNMSMSTYTYAPAAQLISLDGYVDGNTHTQV